VYPLRKITYTAYAHEEQSIHQAAARRDELVASTIMGWRNTSRAKNKSKKKIHPRSCGDANARELLAAATNDRHR